MKSKIAFLLVLSFCISFMGMAQSTVHESLKFHSEKLGRDVSYSVYLPDGYDTSSRLYPVLYLLHGYTDNETAWVQQGCMQEITDHAIESGSAVPMIVVMPDAWDTWYVNQYDGKAPYEDMFFEELIPFVEKTYRARSSKEFRAIAGLSMGGFGSFLYSLHHPDMFSACAPLSAAVFEDSVLEQRKETKSHGNLFNRICGPGLDHWHKNSVLKILSELDKEHLPQVRYYVDCGDRDDLLDGNYRAHQLMNEKGIKHEFRVRGGEHNWMYWRTALPEVLHFISEPFRRNY